MKDYNLTTSMADRMSYDEMLNSFALDALSSADEYKQMPDDEIMDCLMAAYDMDAAHDFIVVDDIEEARARAFGVFASSIEEWQVWSEVKKNG